MLKTISEMSRQLKDSRFFRRLIGKRTVKVTADGWPIGFNPHEPGVGIVMQQTGRVYHVGKHGEWRRDRDAERLMRERRKAA